MEVNHNIFFGAQLLWLPLPGGPPAAADSAGYPSASVDMQVVHNSTVTTAKLNLCMLHVCNAGPCVGMHPDLADFKKLWPGLIGDASNP